MEEMQMNKLSEKIRILCKNREWTQSQLADAICLSESAIQKWETEKNDPPIVELKRLADIFQVSFADLVDDEVEILEYNEIFRIAAGELFEQSAQNDSSSHKIFDAGLRKGATLHRFLNNAGIPYSAIYIGSREVFSCERAQEPQMISYWNGLDSVCL